MWSPYWYAGDQDLVTGARAEAAFFKPTPPDAVQRGFTLQFWCGAVEEGMSERRDTTIVRIEHPELGELRSVVTGLEYEFELVDGRFVAADAEGESFEGIEHDEDGNTVVGDSNMDSDFAPGYVVLPRGVEPPTTWDLTVTVVVGPGVRWARGRDRRLRRSFRRDS